MTYNVGYSLEAAVYAEHLKLALFRAGVLHLLKPSTGNKANQNEPKPCTQGKIRRYGALAAPLCTQIPNLTQRLLRSSNAEAVRLLEERVGSQLFGNGGLRSVTRKYNGL